AETVARGRKGVVQVGEPKSDAGRRTLPVPPALSAMLVDHLAARGVAAGDADALLFTDEETGRTTYQGLGFHDLRRASATGLVAAGVDVKTAQAVLGHTDSRVTLDLYAQVVTEQHKAAVEATAARFFDRPARGRRGMQSSDGSDGDSAGTRREGL
ncbi:MAG: tyrosine-type recombinase/integrase, partial [Acidimicrobiales bacterium]